VSEQIEHKRKDKCLREVEVARVAPQLGAVQTAKVTRTLRTALEATRTTMRRRPQAAAVITTRLQDQVRLLAQASTRKTEAHLEEAILITRTPVGLALTSRVLGLCVRVCAVTRQKRENASSSSSSSNSTPAMNQLYVFE